MIKLTRLDGTEFYINPDLIECIEETPDTVLTLTNGNHFLVQEKVRCITDRIISFKAMIIRRSSTLTKPCYLKRRYEIHSRFIRDKEE